MREFDEYRDKEHLNKWIAHVRNMYPGMHPELIEAEGTLLAHVNSTGSHHISNLCPRLQFDIPGGQWNKRTIEAVVRGYHKDHNDRLLELARRVVQLYEKHVIGASE